jgi:glyoxylase-like metal-dependent hydrolase (beta-lactamase superfamily II)
MAAHDNEVHLIPNQGWDERILVCRNGTLVDTHIIVTQRYVVLLDTVINATTAAGIVAVAEPFLDGRQLLVINTHADYDHCWGNQLFAGSPPRHPAPIIASRLCAEQFANPETAQLLKGMQANEPAIFNEVVLTPPTIHFDEALTIEGGDLTLQLLPTPGHTIDHISVFIPEIETLLAADAAELPFPAARTVHGLPEMRRSLTRLAALNPTHTLYCHAPVTIGPQLLHDNIAYFDSVEEHCRTALAWGLGLEDAGDQDIADLIDLPFEQAVPDNEHWRSVHEFYRTQGHAQQIRMMLAWLSQSAIIG